MYKKSPPPPWSKKKYLYLSRKIICLSSSPTLRENLSPVSKTVPPNPGVSCLTAIGLQMGAVMLRVNC